MKHLRTALLTTATVVATAAFAQQITLKDAYRDYWNTGVSVNQWQVKANSKSLADQTITGGIDTDQTKDWDVIVRNFNYVVAENCMKCEVIHPQEGVYDFTLADQFVDKARAAGLKVLGHCLIWHSQCAPWFHYDEQGNLVSPEVLKKRMREHITPKLRREWVKDKKPEEALKACQIFCENADLTGAGVIIPGVNDGDVLRQTCNTLEEWGAKGFILMRFANTFNEGLILGNEPILKGIESQPVEEFGQLVEEINKEYNFRVTGTPLCDPETGGPFAIAKDENEIFLQFIKKVTGEATIITSKIAAPFISKIFDKIDADNVNVIGVPKEIACLITKEDLEQIDLSEVKQAVIIPGRAFVHQLDAERILSADGVERIVGRGPDTLTIDGELSFDKTDENVIEEELTQFNDLVDAINFFGMRI